MYLPNLLAWLIASMLPMFIGFAWYSPVLFGKAWTKEMGWTKADDIKEKQKGVGKAYAAMFVGNIVMAFVLSNLVQLTESFNLITGAILGFWCWLGFIATTSMGSVFFESKSWKLFWINQGYNLVMLVSMGAIFGAWR